VSALQAAPAIFPLKDVRAGQRGIGRTVFNGSRVEEFQVEILGVLENLGPRESIILARLKGGPLENTGVMQGMSGSPVYIDGKLVGAVAMGFPLSKEAIAGIRPIEDMLRVDPGAAPARNVASASPPPRRRPFFAGETRLEEIATPVSFSGFTGATLDHFAPQLREFGWDPRQGISGGGAPSDRLGDPRQLEPGSMISVQLLSGDMSVGAAPSPPSTAIACMPSATDFWPRVRLTCRSRAPKSSRCCPICPAPSRSQPPANGWAPSPRTATPPSPASPAGKPS
jgi:hypothetical protein